MRDHLGQFVLSSNLQFARGILLLDDCEGTCTWTASATDANATVTFDTAAAFIGVNGLKLFSGDADPAENDYVAATKYLSPPEAGLLCFRARLASPDISLLKTIDIILYYCDGSHLYQFSLRYTVADGSIKYYPASGTLTAIPTLATPINDLQWVNIELIADTRDLAYISARFNGIYASLAGIAPYDTGADTTRRLDLRIITTIAGATEGTLYADCIYAGEFEQI